VVWLSAVILGFQGATLALDLLNCTVLSWLYVRRHGLEEDLGGPAGAVADPMGAVMPRPLDPDRTQQWVPASAERDLARASWASRARASGPELRDPMGVFCKRPHDRIDAGVSQGLSILAGLALGGSVGSGGGRPEP
jgi:hypothetical protein